MVTDGVLVAIIVILLAAAGAGALVTRSKRRRRKRESVPASTPSGRPLPPPVADRDREDDVGEWAGDPTNSWIEGG